LIFTRDDHNLYVHSKQSIIRPISENNRIVIFISSSDHIVTFDAKYHIVSCYFMYGEHRVRVIRHHDVFVTPRTCKPVYRSVLKQRVW